MGADMYEERSMRDGLLGVMPIIDAEELTSSRGFPV